MGMVKKIKILNYREKESLKNRMLTKYKKLQQAMLNILKKKNLSNKDELRFNREFKIFQKKFDKTHILKMKNQILNELQKQKINSSKISTDVSYSRCIKNDLKNI